ncbi:MAG: ATP-dependent RecD-like DNA helicase [Candidatus Promineifilaceae bacterium]
MSVEQTELRGSVERITYYNAENGYSVVRIRPDSRRMLPYAHGARRDELATVVGNLPEVQPGEWLRLLGKWSRHAQHGWQFSAETVKQGRPSTVEGIKRYLGSGLIRGVGPKMAERIVTRFGEDTLGIIDDDPDQLLSVLGIGKKRVVGIKKAWNEQRAIKEVMLFLQSYGVTTGLAIKIYKQYGDDALETVQKTPYKMVNDVSGIGFKTADNIAKALGLAHDSPDRIEAGIAYTLNRMAGEGHVYVPQNELEPKSAEILAVPQPRIAEVLEELETSELVKCEMIVREVASQPQQTKAPITYDLPKTQPQLVLREEKAIYLTSLYYSEIGVTRRVQRLVDHPTSRVRAGVRGVAPAKLLPMLEKRNGIQLATKQREGVLASIYNKVTILTGGPGTGKTTTLRTLLDLLDKLGRNCVLASPTGRAAKRLTEATDRSAKTVHRLLDFQPGTGFGRNEYNPIDADMVIIDEASMLDLSLANSLLKAINPDSHLLLVGDVDQLPSVGPGDVLNDLIESGVTKVVRLAVVFRQSAQSLIIQNAHRINEGKFPKTDPGAKDFFIFIKEDPAEAANLLVNIVQQRIPLKFGFDPIRDIQVLAPMYNGQMGVSNLNEKLQKALNPPQRGKVERRQGSRVLRVGDKVMQVVNNYDKNVFNGDIGQITQIDTVQQTVMIDVDGTPVVYDFMEVDELVHAYAVSVHKSQGSEYPVVIIPVTTQHYMMLRRNLIYTAITRAKKLCILVGTRKAIRLAISNNRVTARHTALDWRLQTG